MAVVMVASDPALREVLAPTVLHVLAMAEPVREADGLNLRRVSLTFPDAELAGWTSHILPALRAGQGSRLRSWTGWEAAELFAARIARESRSVHAGAILVFDLSPKRHHRPHWYGLVLTKRDDWSLDSLWHQAVGHVQIRATLKHRVRAVTGQGGAWSMPPQRWSADVAAMDAFRRLSRNVHDVCRYALKPLPGGATLPCAGRTVVSGPFEVMLGSFLAATGPLTLGRICDRCDRPLPASKRSHAVWCSPTCRKLAHKATHKGAP